MGEDDNNLFPVCFCPFSIPIDLINILLLLQLVGNDMVLDSCVIWEHLQQSKLSCAVTYLLLVQLFPNHTKYYAYIGMG